MSDETGDDETDHDETDDDSGSAKPHDHLAKQILEAVLEPLCSVKPQFEVVAAAQWIDATSEPLDLDESVWQQAGVLGRMARLPSAFECYQNVLTMHEWHDCLSKRTQWHNHRVRAAKKAKLPPPQMPLLWILCARPCARLLRKLDFGACDGWPSGFYAGPTALMTCVVVIPELPNDPDTLSLRLMGRPAQRDEALLQASLLDRDDLLFMLAQSILDETKLRQTNRWEPTMSTLIDRYRETVRQVRLEGIQEGIQAGRLEGRQEGIQAGRHEGMRAVVERLLVRRFPEQAAWASLLDAVQAPAWDAILDDLLAANDAPAAVAVLQRASQG